MSDCGRGFVASAEVTIEAPIDEVWQALTDPAQIEQYMFGSQVVTDWEVGGEILWKGVWNGTPYQDHGVVLRCDPPRLLSYTHFSPLSGQADVAENHHTVVVGLSGDGEHTRVELTQDNNGSDEARQHSEANWEVMFDGLKRLLEEEPG